MAYNELMERCINHPDRLLSRKEAALMLGVEPGTLARWACVGRHELRYIKIGRRVRYRLRDLQEFIESRAGS